MCDLNLRTHDTNTPTARREFAERVHLFDDQQAALEHLRDHPLTSPESQGWALVFEAQGDVYAELVGGEHFAARARLSDRMFACAEHAQPLYDAYAESIARALDDAARLGWHARGAFGDVLALGCDGVLVILQTRRGMSRVVSAYLPGLGVQGVHEDNRGSLLLREADPMRDEALEHPREAKKRAQQRAKMTPEQRLFHDVVRPVLKKLKQERNSIKIERQRERRDLLSCVEGQHKLRRFEQWQALVEAR